MLTDQQRKIVQRARDRIADPARWCQGSMARTANGEICRFDDKHAQRFCALGALAAELAAEGAVATYKHLRAVDAALQDQWLLGTAGVFGRFRGRVKRC